MYQPTHPFWRLLGTTVAIMIASYLLPGVTVEGFFTAFIVAVVLGLINTFIKPLLVILTLPITVFTLGIFYLVLNALLILAADALVSGFAIDGFWWAVAFSILVTMVTSLLTRTR